MNIKFREFFYVSNILSLLRIVLIFPMYYFLKWETNAGNYWAVFAMFLVALTDWFDGYLARKFNQQSDFGRILDPVADKIAVAIIVILLVTIRDLPLWYVIVIVGRDVLIMLLSLVLMSRMDEVVESNGLGKMTVFTLGVVIILFSLNLDMLKWIFLWISIGLVVVSSVSYFIEMKKILGKSSATV